MVLTPSTMLPLGSALPSFDLPVAPGTGSGAERLSSTELPPRPLLLMLLCSHCPFVKHVETELSRIDADYRSRVTLLGIASNSWITHPQDGPEALAEQARRHGWGFPYVLDQEQTLAKALRAACTPEFYLFAPQATESEPVHGDQTLRYRGQLDASRPGNGVASNGDDLRAALDAVLQGARVSEQQTPSIGCNIKWHPGQEPPWYGQPA